MPLITRHVQSIIASITALVVFVALYSLFNNYMYSTIGRVVFQGYFNDDATVLVSEVKSDGTLKQLDSIHVTGGEKRVTQRVGTHWFNRSIKKLHIEVSAGPEIKPESFIDIHNVTISYPYAKDVFIGQKRIKDTFASAQFSPKYDSVLYFSQPQGNVVLESSATLNQPNVLLSFALASFFALVIFLIIKNAHWQELPAFQDMSLGRHVSSTHEFNAINGLRGVAAILVLFSHTAPGFYAVQVGIAILFVISGFLLSKPFVRDNSRIFSFTNVDQFLTKRIKRILPMYFFYVFIFYVVTLQLETALRHFLLIQAKGHLWPMTQIFLFYMLLPLVLLITSLLHKVSRLLPIVALSIVIYAYLQVFPKTNVFYSGEYSHPFFLYAFLIGVLASYIQYDWLEQKIAAIDKSKYLLWTFSSLFAIVITVFTIIWSAPVSPPKLLEAYISQFYIKCILASFIIVLAVNLPKTLFSSLMSNWLFRSVGIIGFSFYLLHGLGMDIVLGFQSQFLGLEEPSRRSWPFMLSSFAVTYLMAIITYSFVERPFFGFRTTIPATKRSNGSGRIASD